MENSSENVSNVGSGSNTSKEQLITDFNEVVADAEALLKATANQGNEKLATLRAKMEESLGAAKARMAEAQAALLARSRAAAEATDTYVHENPWKAIGMGVSIGLIIGLLLNHHHYRQHDR